MPLMLDNPLGLWALLGIPAVLIIHFLQTERKRVITSTLFLIANVQPQSTGGLRLERLRQSLPLWLQLLAVILITLLLIQPRWPQAGTFQRVVVILDSSASMQPFVQEAIQAAENHTLRRTRTSDAVEWMVLETDPRKGTLYTGSQPDSLRQALNSYHPTSGSHDPSPTINRARLQLQDISTVLFITNRQREPLPEGITEIAVGQPIENTGFTGLQTSTGPEGVSWQILLRNYGKEEARIQWRLAYDDQPLEPSPITLPPGESRSLGGRFPAGVQTALLSLPGDAFALDDWMPIIKPLTKPLTLRAVNEPGDTTFLTRLAGILGNTTLIASDEADLTVAWLNPNEETVNGPAILFTPGSPAPKAGDGPPISERHPLTRDLNWLGMIAHRSSFADEPHVGDRVLVWQGESPLIVLREGIQGRQLVCLFDPTQGNALRFPAFIILLHRFAENSRAAKPGYEQRNLQTGQSIALTPYPGAGPLTLHFTDQSGVTTTQGPVPSHRANMLIAPDRPGFWKVSQGERPLLNAAVHFGDTRQADFLQAETGTRGPDTTPAIVRQNTITDPFKSIWLLLLGLALTTSWIALNRPSKP
jgi:hypothetical protein